MSTQNEKGQPEDEMPTETKQAAPAPETKAPVDAAAITAELETYRASVSKAEQAARLRAIESRIPGHVPEGARKLIARGVLAQLGTFAIDLETLDAKTPQQIIDAIAGAGLDALRPMATPAPAAPAAPAAAAAAAPAPQPIVPPTPTPAAAAPRQSAPRIAGALYPQEQRNPVADALAALVRGS